MKRLIIFIPVLLAFVIALPLPCLAGGLDRLGVERDPSLDLSTAARDALNSIKDPKNSDYQQMLEEQGYISQADIEKAELGEGFQVFHFLTPFDILTGEDVYDPAIHVKPTREWKFLVRIEGKAKTLLCLSYAKFGNNLSFGIGIPLKKDWGSSCYGPIRSASIAKELDSLLSAWPASAGYQHRIVGNIGYLTPYWKLAQVIELSQNGKVLGFIPLTFADGKTPVGVATAGNFTAANLLDPNLFLAKLKSEIKREKKQEEKQRNKK